MRCKIEEKKEMEKPSRASIDNSIKLYTSSSKRYYGHVTQYYHPHKQDESQLRETPQILELDKKF